MFFIILVSGLFLKREAIELYNCVSVYYRIKLKTCEALTKITVESGNTVYDSRENCNAIIETASNTLIAGCQTTVIPESVTSIGAGAFSGCIGLTSITIPKSMTKIEASAFAGCENLKTVFNLSNLEIVKGDLSHGRIAEYADLVINVDEKIDGFCFNTDEEGNHILTYYIWDEQTTELTLPENCKGENYAIGDRVFQNLTAIKSVTIPNSVTSIGFYAFENCSNLISIDIPNSVTSVSGWAFSGCTGLTGISLSNSLTRIEEHTFRKCSALPKIVIPNSVTSIGRSAFYECESLASVTIPESVTSIEEWAFLGCKSLTDVAIPNSVKSIEEHTFQQCTNLKNVSIGESVVSIGDMAFWRDAIESIVIPDMVEVIDTSAFSECSNLKAVAFGKSVKNIEFQAFAACVNLTNVVIPNSVTNIGGSAFLYCQELESAIIGESVEKIGDHAFGNCTSLSRIISFAAEPPVCGAEVFTNVNKETCILQVPTGSKAAYQAAEVWKDFLIVEEGAEGMDELLTDTPDQPAVVDVYTLQGVRVKANVPAREATLGLPGGIYVIGNKKVVVK